MLLNGVERLMMNNPARAAIQRHYEARRLLRLGGRVDGGYVLEVGCGRGVGVEILLEQFGAARVDAFDLDPQMVEAAWKRLARQVADGTVRLWDGSATSIPSEGSSYDAVFDFGIIHHIEDWRAALAEIHRVLRPGGRFYAEEVMASFIHHPLWRRLLDHPRTDRFDRPTFARALAQTGFHVLGAEGLGESFAFFLAEKPEAG